MKVSTGLWRSVDPVGFEGGDCNLYRYVRNSSPRVSDPLGLWCIHTWGGGCIGTTCHGDPRCPSNTPAPPKHTQPITVPKTEPKQEGPETCAALLNEVKAPKATEYAGCVRECAEHAYDPKKLAQCLFGCVKTWLGGTGPEDLKAYFCCLVYSSRRDENGRQLNPCTGSLPESKACCNYYYCECVLNEDPNYMNQIANGLSPGKVYCECNFAATNKCGLGDADWQPPL